MFRNTKNTSWSGWFFSGMLFYLNFFMLFLCLPLATSFRQWVARKEPFLLGMPVRQSCESWTLLAHKNGSSHSGLSWLYDVHSKQLIATVHICCFCFRIFLMQMDLFCCWGGKWNKIKWTGDGFECSPECWICQLRIKQKNGKNKNKVDEATIRIVFQPDVEKRDDSSDALNRSIAWSFARQCWQ